MICIWTLGHSLKFLGHPASGAARYQRALPKSSKCFGLSVEMYLIGPCASHRSKHWTSKRQVNIKTCSYTSWSCSYMLLFLSCLAFFIFRFPCLVLAASHIVQNKWDHNIWLPAFRNWEALDVSVPCPCWKPTCKFFTHFAQFQLSASWCTEPASGTPQWSLQKSEIWEAGDWYSFSELKNPLSTIQRITL